MRQSITLPTGLIETSPAGRVPIGFYDDGVNVRDFDERAQRKRLATRAGVLPLGSGKPCPDGSPVIHSLTAKRSLSRLQFAELTTIADSTITPDQLSEKSSTDYDEEPLASAVGPDGIWHTLHVNGQVTTMDPLGEVSEAFTLTIPAGFTLVPSMVVDELGGVILATTFTRQLGGFASQVTRCRRDGDSDWIKVYDEVLEEVIVKFWGLDSELFMALQRPDNVEVGAEFTLARFGGTNVSNFSRGFTRAIAAPVVDVRRRGADLYVAAAPNRSRSLVNEGNGASVSWTPRELDDADTRLFTWLSALRGQSKQGFVDGSAVTIWQDGKNDDSDFDAVLDETQRAVGDQDGFPAPRFAVDPAHGPEVRFNSPVGSVASVLRTSPLAGNQEKGASTESAPWQRTLMPAMADALSDGARFGMTGLVRVENYELPGTVTFADWKLIWSQGLFSLEYRGETDVELRWLVGGIEPVATTLTLLGPVQDICWTMVFNGRGIPGSFMRINGSVMDTVNITEVARVGSRTYIGGTNDTARPAKFMQGAWREWVSYLGRDILGVHDGAPLQAEYEQVEGFVTNAYGLQSILDNSHPFNNSPPPGAGGFVPGLDFEDAFQSPEGLTIKLNAADGAVRWVRGGPDAGNGIALDSEDGIYTIGTPLDLTDVNPERLSKLIDNGDDFTVDWSVLGGALGSDTIFRGSLVRMYVDGCDRLYVPWVSIGGIPLSELRKYEPDGTPVFTFPMVDGPTFIGPGGLRVDDSFRGGPCADEFLYVTCRSTKKAKRVEILGRQDTGETRDQETEELAVCESGVVSRLSEDRWEVQASDFTPGARPWSFEFFGKVFLGGPEDYRVWDPRAKTLREWTPRPGSIIPPRIFMAVRWRGRVLCVSQDDRHILFGSAYGDAFDFATGGDVILATQAFVGTTAAAGAIPDPITALVVGLDDLVYVGTSRSVWRLTGDPQTGGQLDDVLATEGILGPHAQCRGDSGELYWVTSELRVVQIGGAGMRDISSDTIRGRLQSIDRDKVRVELTWSNDEKGLYLAFIAREGSEGETHTHLFWSARSQRWHPVEFPGGANRRVTSMSVTQGPDAGGWATAFGFADGGLRFVHPEALDDDGEPIPWRVRIPLGGDGDAVRTLVTHAELSIDPRQGPVSVVGIGGLTGAEPDDHSFETVVVPGRGDFIPIQIAAPHTWIELSGVGEQAGIDDIAVDIQPWGAN